MTDHLLRIYEKIPTNLIYGFRMFLILLGFLAFLFTGLQIEEWVIGCSGGMTLLQRSGLSMEFEDGICNDSQFTNWSIITIVASGLYGITMVIFSGVCRDAWIKRKLGEVTN